MKFCCDKFKSDWNFPRNVGLNIRVSKFHPRDFNFLIKKEMYRFYITSGYKDNTKAEPNLVIAHCPYCGTNLFKYYKDDYYINESKEYFL